MFCFAILSQLIDHFGQIRKTLVYVDQFFQPNAFKVSGIFNPLAPGQVDDVKS